MNNKAPFFDKILNNVLRIKEANKEYRKFDVENIIF